MDEIMNKLNMDDPKSKSLWLFYNQNLFHHQASRTSAFIVYLFKMFSSRPIGEKYELSKLHCYSNFQLHAWYHISITNYKC